MFGTNAFVVIPDAMKLLIRLLSLPAQKKKRQTSYIYIYFFSSFSKICKPTEDAK